MCIIISRPISSTGLYLLLFKGNSTPAQIPVATDIEVIVAGDRFPNSRYAQIVNTVENECDNFPGHV